MKASVIFFVSLLSRANAIGWGSVRGEEVSIDLACTLKGGSAENTCDATKSDDGSTCVWCELSSYGVCVSETIASQMKLQIPGLDCDDDGRTDDDNDDDNAAIDDDDAPSTDDDMPDEYWKCIEKYSTAEECAEAGCSWCNNKGGYGVCFDKETAKSFDDSDWYSCNLASSSGLTVEDPSDPTCIAATLGGDESSCKATMDADGKPCDWCSFQSYEFCINVDQAQIAEQYGASCGDRANAESDAPEAKTKNVSDPSDPTCVAATLGGDESSCKATMDADGKPCDWCSFQGYDFCADQDQAQIIGQYGASCSNDEESELSDPSDPTCPAATIGGDASSCKATMDADGKPCDWCSFQGYDFCADHDQAQIIEQYGASCGDRKENNASTSVA